MDDIYTFGQKPYVPADPIDTSIGRFVKNVCIFLVTGVKCAILGPFILLKSMVYLLIPRPSKDIRNQIALITGGANGIGRSLGIELAKCGCHVAIADVDVNGSLDTVEELRLLGVEAFSYEVDVANYDEIVALKDRIRADLGEVDILINNAGLLPRVSLLQGNPEDVLRIIKVNLVSHFWTLRAFLPGMMARGSGHIVALASIMAYESTARAICYSSTKFGIRGLMDGLYDLFRLDHLNINVTTVFPALVNTRKEFIDQFVANNGLNFAAELAYYTPQEVAETTITAILKNKKYVSMPSFYQQTFSCIGLLPSSFQNLIRDNFKPNVGAAVNEPNTRKSSTQRQYST